MSDTDRIETEVFIAAPVGRVWQALTDAAQFGEWFGVRLEGPFAPGARVRGAITHPDYAHLVFEIVIERMESGRLLSWRWHPHAIDSNIDYSAEPTTQVVFKLEEEPGGTRLKLTESGFDALPPSRRQEAFRGNQAGWSAQMVSIENYVRTH